MDCIQTSNKAVDLFGAGKHGFKVGNPAGGELATYMSPAWCNGVQEEILNVVRAASIVPSGADLSQMLQAIQALILAATGGPGQIRAFARTTAPTGMLKCNGAAISRTAYAALFAVIGTTFGAGDGATTFNLPDLRGEFIRGWDDGRAVDAGRTMGSAQGDANKPHGHTLTMNAVAPHNHPVTIDAVGDHNHTDGTHTNLLIPPYNGSLTGTDTTGSGSEQAVGPGDSAPMVAAGGHAHTGSTSNAGGHTPTGSADSAGGPESRPRNVALLYCITY